MDAEQFGLARHLAEAIRWQPFCTAVIAGVHAGRIFDDDVGHPVTACVTRPDLWCFALGDPHNDAYNAALAESMFAGDAVSGEVGVYLRAGPVGLQPAVDVPIAPPCPYGTPALCQSQSPL